MLLYSALNHTADTVLMVSTGASASAIGTYLRLLLNGCVESGALFVVWPSPESYEFEGVALWGPPSNDWLPWCVSPTPHFMPTSDSRPGKRKSSYLNYNRRRESG